MLYTPNPLVCGMQNRFLSIFLSTFPGLVYGRAMSTNHRVTPRHGNTAHYRVSRDRSATSVHCQKPPFVACRRHIASVLLFDWNTIELRMLRNFLEETFCAHVFDRKLSRYSIRVGKLLAYLTALRVAVNRCERSEYRFFTL